MNSNERIEAVRLALEIIEQRRMKRITKEQASALITALNLGVPLSAEVDS